jgi:hypothetical protein
MMKALVSEQPSHRDFAPFPDDVSMADPGPKSELWRKVGDGVNQAAFLICGAASIPSLNMTP